MKNPTEITVKTDEGEVTLSDVRTWWYDDESVLAIEKQSGEVLKFPNGTVL